MRVSNISYCKNGKWVNVKACPATFVIQHLFVLILFHLSLKHSISKMLNSRKVTRPENEQYIIYLLIFTPESPFWWFDKSYFRNRNVIDIKLFPFARIVTQSKLYFVLVKILFPNSHKVSCLVLRKLTARLMLHFIGSTCRLSAASSNLRQLKWLDMIIGSRACLRIALNRSGLRTLRLQMLLPTLQSGLSEGSFRICFVASKLFVPSRE